MNLIAESVAPPRVGRARKTSFRPDIEGLRGIAVLLIIAFHAHIPGVSGGFIGVDVFFVLSGFLITGLLISEIEQTGRISFTNFYARRIRRLLPAAALVFCVTLVACAVLLSPFEQFVFSRTSLAASTYVSNLWFLRQAFSYFHPGVELNPFLHTWSLAVEEQFYLVWPLLVLLAMGARRSRPSLALAMAALTIVSLTASIVLSKSQPTVAFFSSPIRAWEFGIGALAMLLSEKRSDTNSRISALVGWAGLIAVLVAGWQFRPQMTFPGIAALLPVLGTAAVLFAGAAHSVGPVALLRRGPLQYAGRISYSWYLWHWPMLALAASLVPGLTVGARIVIVFAALGIADLTHRLVENPIRFNKFLGARPRASVAMGLALTIIGAATALGMGAQAARAKASPAQSAVREAVASVLPCTARIEATRPTVCTFGDTTSARTVVLMGDSHSGQWVPALSAIGKANGWKLVTFIKAGCPAAVVPMLTAYDKNYSACQRWRELALAHMRELDPSAIIVSNYQIYMSERNNWSNPQATWTAGVHDMLAQLSTVAPLIFLLRDTPKPLAHVPFCLSRQIAARLYTNRGCNIPRARGLDESVWQAEQNASADLPRVHLIDLSNFFCDRVVCEVVKGGTVVYRDGSHVSNKYVLALVPALTNSVAAISETQ